jgi:hypothetical protein
MSNKDKTHAKYLYISSVLSTLWLALLVIAGRLMVKEVTRSDHISAGKIIK